MLQPLCPEGANRVRVKQLLGLSQIGIWLKNTILIYPNIKVQSTN
jgi:hypothetical protein